MKRTIRERCIEDIFKGWYRHTPKQAVDVVLREVLRGLPKAWPKSSRVMMATKSGEVIGWADHDAYNRALRDVRRAIREGAGK